MELLLTKAAELVGGLSDIKHIHLYLGPSGKSIPGYTSDLLVVDFRDNTRKLYYRTPNFAYCKHAEVTGQRSVVGYYGKRTR